MTERTKYEFVQERNERMNEKQEMRKIIEGEKNRDSWEEITAEMEIRMNRKECFVLLLLTKMRLCF